MMRFLLLLFVGLSSFLLRAQYSEKAQRKIDSLNTIIEANPYDTGGVHALNSLTATLFSYDKDTLLPMATQVKERATKGLERKNLSEEEIRTYKIMLGDAISNIGYAHKYKGDFKKGLDYYYKALKVREEIQDDGSLANSYNNIASIYNTIEDHEKAIEYYKKSLQYRLNVGELKGIALAYNNIGYTFDKLGETDSTIRYYQLAHDFYKKAESQSGLARTLTNLGTIYMDLGQLDTAMVLLKKGLELREKLNSKGGKFYANYNLASLYLVLEEYEKAYPIAKRAYDLALELESPEYMYFGSLVMYKTYKKKGKYKESLEMHETYLEFRDSIKSEKLQNDLIQMRFENEYQRKAAADSTRAAEAKKVADATLAAERAENARRKQQSYFLYAGIGLALIFGFFIFNRFLVTRKQKGLIEEQKVVVEEKNQEILDSITYAKGIQDAILPSSNQLNQLLDQHFVYYQPKDIVAGDFYWVDEVDNGVVFAAADCTGHGVPGAMVSVVCHNALHRSIHEFGLSSPEKILEKTRSLVIETFESTEREVKDGMDISLCVIDRSKKKLLFAGANNNLYLVRSGELKEFKADKQPVGKHTSEKPFSLHEIDLEENDMLYVFTDGFPDQFGGERGKKFKYKNFKDLLLKHSAEELSAQHNLLLNSFENWKGDFEQLDDVCVIGVRL